MNHVTVGDSLLVHGQLGQGGVGETGGQRLGGDVVEENLIGAPRSRVLAVGGEGSGEDGVETGRQRLPLHLAVVDHLALGTLLNPQLEQPQFLRVERSRGDLVFQWRHGGILGMGRGGKENALLGLAGDHAVGLSDVLGRLQNKVCLGLGAIMAGKAVGSQDRQNLALEIHRLDALDFSHGQRSFFRCLNVICLQAGQKHSPNDEELNLFHGFL